MVTTNNELKQRMKWMAFICSMLVGCSAEGDGSDRPVPPASTAPSTAKSAAGGGGYFDGAAGSAVAAEPIPEVSDQERPLFRDTNCEPGLYLGTYNCDIDMGTGPVPLAGDVSFNLEVNTSGTEQADCDEFCADLVIAEGTGVLYGVLGFLGFEAQLSGGLDCQTGEFRASAPGGIYGMAVSSDPNDPNALWTVAEPPFGTFGGDMQGTYDTGSPQAIDGSWSLADDFSGVACTGPFEVTLTL